MKAKPNRSAVSAKVALLVDAVKIVGDRGAHYGPPSVHFSTTAAILTALLRDKLKPGASICAEDWGRFMVADKLVRDLFKPKRDNLIDVAGYAACIGEIREAREGGAA